jgi:hypothetical protein
VAGQPAGMYMVAVFRVTPAGVNPGKMSKAGAIGNYRRERISAVAANQLPVS